MNNYQILRALDQSQLYLIKNTSLAEEVIVQEANFVWLMNEDKPHFQRGVARREKEANNMTFATFINRELANAV